MLPEVGAIHVPHRGVESVFVVTTPEKVVDLAGHVVNGVVDKRRDLPGRHAL
jgi:hypothetical protein